jgi:putative ABC transport system permease protein
MKELLQEVRFALRQLRQSPGFTAVAVLTRALGMGASRAMFGVMNAILLRPWRFRDPDRLLRIFSTQPGAVVGASALDVRDFAAQNRTVEKIAVCDSGWRKNVSALPGPAEPERRIPLCAAGNSRTQGSQGRSHGGIALPVSN